MSCGVKLPPVLRPFRGVMNGGSGVSIGGVRILREQPKFLSGHVTFANKKCSLTKPPRNSCVNFTKAGKLWSTYIQKAQKECTNRKGGLCLKPKTAAFRWMFGDFQPFPM